MRKRILLFALYFGISNMMVSCGIGQVKPTDTPLPTPTSTYTTTVTQTLAPTATPTDTPTPTRTIQPSLTLTPSITFTLTLKPPSATPTVFKLPTPEDTPLPAWNNIPVMPGAIAGDATPAMYIFIVKATVNDVQAYYDKELPKTGWMRWATGTSPNGSMMVFYQKGTQSLAVSIFLQGEVTFVMLVLT